MNIQRYLLNIFLILGPFQMNACYVTEINFAYNQYLFPPEFLVIDHPVILQFRSLNSLTALGMRYILRHFFYDG